MADVGHAARSWKAVAVFFAANVLFGAGLYFHAFLYNFYLQSLGHGEGVMGVAAAALSAGGLLALVPAGLAVDRLGIRATYTAAVGVAAVGLALGAVVETPIPAYLAAAVAGGGAAGWRVAMGPAIMRLASDRIRTRAFSWNTALLVGSGAVWTGGAGAAAAVLQSGLDLDRTGGLRAALLLGSLATASAALLAPLALRGAAVRDGAGHGGPEPDTASPDGSAGTPVRPGDRGARGVRARLRALAIPRPVALLIVGVGVFWTAGALALPFYNIYFQREFGLDIARIGLILGGGQALTAIAVFSSGEAAARLGPRRILAAWMLLLPPTLWALAGAPVAAVATVFFLLQAAVLPAVYPLVDQIVLERVPARRHGAVSGWRNVATEGSGLVGATVGGYMLAALSFPALFAAAGAIALLAAAATIAMLRHQRSSGSPASRRSATRRRASRNNRSP